mmetsp:Transcript_12565/g.45835  ORF Transcript_12565/g.45835 Transcript_12565/m.45835 type:complete len:173 (+) Transcript_12565:162-680(+)
MTEILPVKELALAGGDVLEYSVHSVPKVYKSTFVDMFPKVDVEKMLVVPTCQHSKLDIVQVGEAVEDEKNRLLENFFRFAEKVAEKLKAREQWVDYCDPCSGLRMIHKDNSIVYNEVDGLATLLKYSTMSTGCCKIVSHPRWGTSVYPSTLFTLAPSDVLEEAIQEVAAELQ